MNIFNFFKNKPRFFFTQNGNVLVDEGQRQYFQDKHGEFLRPCSPSEFAHLKGQLFEFKPISKLQLALEKNESFPKWYLLTSARIQDNYENYNPRFCNNGGCYSFHQIAHIFFSKQKNGVKFGILYENYSSADFRMTWDGHFQNDGTYIYFSNCDEDIRPFYNFNVYDGDEKLYDVEEPIEKYLDFCELDYIFALQYTLIPERDEESEIQTSPLFSEDEKGEMLSRLKTFGYQEIKNKRTIRQNSRR